MLLDVLSESLSTIPRFTDEHGNLLRSAVVDAALGLDPEIIQLVIQEPELKAQFITVVNDVMVFDKMKFIWVVDSKAFLPDSYTSYKNKIGLANGRDEMSSGTSDISLVWPYKDCILEGGQTKEEAKHDEVFYNELLAPQQVSRLLSPKVLSKAVRHDKNGAATANAFGNRDNLIIQGNNLVALHSLLPRFRGRIKLIYIDPPYYFDANKAEDTFSYNSNFKKSTWLTFMKNRLEVAQKLLTEDGSIFVQISDDGVAELHLLMKEIFPGQFINKITVRTKSASGFASVNAGLFETAEYILCFGKDKKKWTYHPQYVKADYDKNYKWYVTNKEDPHTEWQIASLPDVYAHQSEYKSAKDMRDRVGEFAFQAGLARFANENANSVFRYTVINNNASKELQSARDSSQHHPDQVIYIEREGNYNVYVRNGQEMAFYSKKMKEIDGELVPTTLLTNIWTDTPYEGIAKEGGVTLQGGKKPERLIRRIIELASSPGDIVLDYHLGSGTTAAVAHKLGRRYIGCEQLDYGQHGAVTRLRNVISGDKSGISKAVDWKGGGSFVHCELATCNEETLSRIQSASTSQELLDTMNELIVLGNLRPEVLPESLSNSTDDFLALSLEAQRLVVAELVDKNRLYVSYSDIDDETFQIGDEDKAFSASFYKDGVF